MEPRIPNVIYHSPSRGDCGLDCPTFGQKRQKLVDQWRQLADKELAGEATAENISEAFIALRGISDLVDLTWQCSGRMDLALGDKETPCRNPAMLEEVI